MDSMTKSVVMAANADYLSAVAELAADMGVDATPGDVVDAISSVGETLSAMGHDPLPALMSMRFYNETPPPPPYKSVRFDDRREAEDFRRRVKAAHGVELTIRPGDGRILFVD